MTMLTTGEPDADEEPERTACGPNGPAAVLRILVVDDNPDVCRLLVRMLELAGYPSACAHDGPAALASVAACAPAMVILDVMMPDMDGFTVLRRLRAAPASTGLPVVMFSAIDDDGSRDLARELGASEYVVKGNLRFATLRALVGRYLGSPN